MKTVILGAMGQLGQELAPLLGGEVVALDHSRGDLEKPGELRARLDAHAPDVVVNCAAYNFVDRAESEADRAFAVNALRVRDLAAWTARAGCLLVHFSTDHVFGRDHARRTPYLEDDQPGPVGVYGQSKLAGELMIRAQCVRWIIVRTCGLYGLHGRGGKGNFVETILRLARTRPELRVVDDQVCTPTAVADLAAATVGLIRAGRSGVYHRTNAGSCSWYEFARAALEHAGLDTPVVPIASEEFPAAARRPAFSVLGGRLPELRPWREALAEYMNRRSAGQNLPAAA